jgi:hypothetical protein
VELGGPFKILAKQLRIKAGNRKMPVTGEAIAPVAIQAGSSDTGAEAINLVNRSGLRDGDADDLDEHSVDPACMWRSAKGETSSRVEFDLGQARPVGTICIWNYNDAWRTDCGVGKADISVWTQQAGWQKVREGVSLEQAEGSDDYDEPMYIELGAVTAQKIRLDTLANFGNADHVGLSEVQFFGPHGPQADKPAPGRSGNLAAVVLILAVVSLVAGVSMLGRRKTS